MAKTYLLEIGLEEMPAHVVTPSVLQLKERMTKFLKDERLNFSAIKTFSTPRRLTVEVSGLDDKQADVKKKSGVRLRKLPWTRMATGRKRRLAFLKVRVLQLTTLCSKKSRARRTFSCKPLRQVRPHKKF